MVQIKDVGFIGTGIMGKSMLRNLGKNGYTMHCYARHPQKIQDLIQEGVKIHSSISECVQACQVMITMVGFPKDVEQVYFSPNAIFDSARAGSYLIDMTTTSPTLAEKLYKEGKQRGFHVLDAPVTGGDSGAKNGTLSILVGGEKEDYKQMLPLFKGMGTNINYMGSAGKGQHAKMANQIMIAGALSGVCEALSYAKANGLDLETLLKAVSTGAAGSAQLDAFGEKIIQRNYAPGFFLKHFVKDMKLATEEADKKGLHLNILRQVLKEYIELEKEGKGDLGTQTLITYYQEK